MFRYYSLGNTLYCHAELLGCRADIVGNDECEIVSRAHSTSRMVLQQQSSFIEESSSGHDNKVRRFSLKFKINSPARECRREITVAGNQQERLTADIRHHLAVPGSLTRTYSNLAFWQSQLS